MKALCANGGAIQRRRSSISASFSAQGRTQTQPGHVKFISEVAGLEPPVHLHTLLNVLQVKGEEIAAPESRKNIHPLVIPLTKDPNTEVVTALLRWPTPPEGMEMPVVQVQKHGVSLLAKSVDQYVHRILVEEDVQGEEVCYKASGDIGKALYTRGSFQDSKLNSLEAYLMRKVGHFPDVFERLAMNHLKKGDKVSALVTGEYYVSKKHFPGFGRPMVFNAELMTKLGRKSEAKDAARIALKSPWWTLGCPYETVAELAGWGDEQVEYMRERMTEEGTKEELQKGKVPAQVALDQAAFLLDLAAIDGSWDAIREQLASFYKEAGLHSVSRFILHGAS